MVEATVAASFHKERLSKEAVASSCWQGLSALGKTLPYVRAPFGLRLMPYLPFRCFLV